MGIMLTRPSDKAIFYFGFFRDTDYLREHGWRPLTEDEFRLTQEIGMEYQCSYLNGGGGSEIEDMMMDTGEDALQEDTTSPAILKSPNNE